MLRATKVGERALTQDGLRSVNEAKDHINIGYLAAGSGWCAE